MAEGHVLGGRARELVPRALALPRGPSAYARIAERVELVRALEHRAVVVQRVGGDLDARAPRDVRAVAEREVLHRLAAHRHWRAAVSRLETQAKRRREGKGEEGGGRESYGG